MSNFFKPADFKDFDEASAPQQLPDGTPEQWVELAYDDVPPRMWPLAQRSLLAHVERIRSLKPGND